MNDNKSFKDLLWDLENDNVTKLSADNSEHKFSKEFEKKALAVCRGEQTTNPTRFIRRKRLPLWAAAVIILLLGMMITGCAIAVYNHFFRSVPFVGVTEPNDDVALYSTTESYVIDDLKVETILLLIQEDSVKLMMWAELNYWEVTSDRPVAQIKCGDTTIDLFSRSMSGEQKVYAEGTVDKIDYRKKATLLYNGKEQAIKFADISDKGYEVSEWAVLEGITFKILPIYTNNRLLLLEMEGIEDAIVSASLTLYDSNGSSTKSNGFNLLDDKFALIEAAETLGGDIVKIEIEHIRVIKETEEQSVTVPLTGDDVDINIPLYDSPVFADTATHIKRDGKYVYLTAKMYGKSDSGFTDFWAHYDFGSAKHVDESLIYGDDGSHIYTYKLEVPKDAAELCIKGLGYDCMMFGGDEPLAEIIINKK